MKARRWAVRVAIVLAALFALAMYVDGILNLLTTGVG